MSQLVLTSDTLAVTPTAGAFEYASPIIAATPIGTQRGVVPTSQFYRLDSALAGANVNTAQSLFGVGCTLSASTVYEFELVFAITKTAGTTSHTIGVGFGGTATVNNFYANGFYNNSTTSTPTTTSNSASVVMTSASNIVLTGAITSAAEYLMLTLRGAVSINAGGTFIPQYTLSAAPGGAYSTLASSFIRIAPISASGAATNVGTWA